MRTVRLHGREERLAEYDKTITNATEFYIGHLERVRRCKITIAGRAVELLDAKRKMADLRFT